MTTGHCPDQRTTIPETTMTGGAPSQHRHYRTGGNIRLRRGIRSRPHSAIPPLRSGSRVFHEANGESEVSRVKSDDSGVVIGLRDPSAAMYLRVLQGTGGKTEIPWLVW